MRITKVSLTAFRGVSSNLDLPFDKDGKNLLVYGENGSAKTSFARALELLFSPVARSDQDILAHKNLFVDAMPMIEVTFTDETEGASHTETVTWTQESGKPTPSWLLSSAARSAFLDHRKLLQLSDRTRRLPKRFFIIAAEYLFSHLSAGGTTVSAIWDKIQTDVQKYREAKTARTAEADSGVADPMAHYRPIEEAVNQLNIALDDYLLPRGDASPPIVIEAERLLKQFEGHNLTISLEFEHLTFNRQAGTLSGGELTPKVTYCKRPLGSDLGATWVSTHHEVLNEARLTALALALFFSAVKLQDQVRYIAGAGDPAQPARLLVLDDILVGLDYGHRIPVLELIREEFAAGGRHQVILFTHDRVWFDLCRLQLEPSEWKTEEFFARRGAGPESSDFPVRKQAPCELAARAQTFLNDGELPAAANYARTSIETSLKRICDKRDTPIAFSLNPDSLKIDLFIEAASREPKIAGAAVGPGTRMLLSKRLQGTIKAIRTTVLNPLSHAHPTTVTPTEVKRAIAIANELVTIARSL